jgi:hypothetical protein
MPPIAARTLALCILAAGLVFPAAQDVKAQRTGAPPHTFLFGSWTGGLFPPPSKVSAAACLAQPSVIFTRDAVLRATLTDVLYIERAVETVRGTGNGVDISLVPSSAAQGQDLLRAGDPGLGFGCETPNVLHVRRLSPNEVEFPDCRDFPFPLVRCPAG